MSEPLDYTIHERIISFESILFILLYNALNGLLFMAYLLSLFLKLSTTYLFVIEGLILLSLTVYIETLYRTLPMDSRRSTISNVFYHEINSSLLQKLQIYIVSTSILFILIPFLGLPLFIEQGISYNLITGLMLLQSSFWIMTYAHIFKYRPDIDTEIIEELKEE